ncbi:MAG: zinc ribbon domain-containing protein [Deltaproteobacteria bacterium]|nr:zinc ribbon domain-containing protein [Deltaproteobacteria bacterium]
MPIYVYMCQACGLFEKNQAISDPPLNCCPHCGQEVRHRIQPRNDHIIQESTPACREVPPRREEGA